MSSFYYLISIFPGNDDAYCATTAGAIAWVFILTDAKLEITIIARHKTDAEKGLVKSFFIINP